VDQYYRSTIAIIAPNLTHWQVAEVVNRFRSQQGVTPKHINDLG
jgi:hypothetical protein